MTAGRLTTRPFRDADLPGVQRLWDEATEWGAPDAETWRTWQQSPWGSALVQVTVDEAERLVGQISFLPIRLVVDDREVKAVRMSAPILSPVLRSWSLRQADHPIRTLGVSGVERAAEEGHELVYMMPKATWMPLFTAWARGMSSYAVLRYPCVGIRGDEIGTAAVGERFTPRRATQFGAEHEELWQAARVGLPVRCGVIRSPAWLRFRFGGDTVIEAWDADGALAGYAAVRQDRLLVDLLARRREELAPVLAAALGWLVAEDGGGETEDGFVLKAMQTPPLEPVLADLGFGPVRYRFAFACRPLAADLAAEAVAPERWYLMPRD